MINRAILAGALLAAPAIAQNADDRFGVEDLARLAEVSEPALSPDGAAIAYSVTTTNAEADKKQSDLWRVSWDGSQRRALTQTPGSSEWQPSWSADGRSLVFLADRGGDDAKT